jgi:hypothetical protein
MVREARLVAVCLPSNVNKGIVVEICALK